MNIGVVIVTHYRLGEEFLHALRLIVPDASNFHSVAIDPDQSVDEMRGSIEKALSAAEAGDGVLVLTVLGYGLLLAFPGPDRSGWIRRLETSEAGGGGSTENDGGRANLGDLRQQLVVDGLQHVMRLVVVGAGQDGIGADAPDDVPVRVVVRRGIGAFVIMGIIGYHF